MKTWYCKIGEVDVETLAHGADAPMRAAVATAYHELTGEDPNFMFSGWGDELTERERASVEGREPNSHCTELLMGRVDRIRQLARLGDPLPDWTPEQFVAAIAVKLGQASHFLHAGQYTHEPDPAELAEDRGLGVENLLACAAACLDAVESIEGRP